MLFETKKEMQSLINSRTKALDLAENQIANRNKFIAYQERKIESQDNLINRIENLLSANKYNNEKVVLDKIKELVSDYQSKN